MATESAVHLVFLELLPIAAAPVVIAVAVALLALWIAGDVSKPPPKVYGLPLIGYRPDKEPYYIAFQNLRRKYGDIFSIRLGGDYTVVCGSCQYIKELYSKPELLGRPPNTFMSVFPDGGGLYDCSGKPWDEQQKLALKVMKDVASDRAEIQALFKEELREFMKLLETTEGSPVDVLSTLTLTMYNVMSIVLLGKRFEYDDPRAQLFQAVYTATDNIRDGPRYMSWLKWALSLIAADRQVAERTALLLKWNTFFRYEIEGHRAQFDSSHLRDFIDHFLAAMDGVDNSSLTDSALRGTLQSMALAGTVDMVSVLAWALLAMAAFPNVQKKLRVEVDEAIGRGRQPTVEDWDKMPYTKAVFREVNRWRTIAPLGCPRYALTDTFIGNFFIPKKTVVIPNLWAVHHDPDYWKDPEQFLPERHLSSDGKDTVHHDRFIPFGLGKRQSPGKKMAEVQTFLYLTNILQRFSVQMADGVKPDLQGHLGINLHPREQRVCFVPRNEPFSPCEEEV